MLALINPKWDDDMANGYDVELAKLNTCEISKDMSFLIFLVHSYKCLSSKCS